MKIVGIIKPSKDATAPFLSASLCYTHALTEYYIDELGKTEMVKQQISNTENNIISGLPFILNETEALTDEQKMQEFRDYVSELTDNEKAALYKRILATPKESFIQETIDTLLKGYKDKTAEDEKLMREKEQEKMNMFHVEL